MTEQRIVNTFDQLKAAVAAKIIPKKHALALSRGEHGTVIVWSPFFKTDLKAAWYHHEQKAFFGDGVGHARHANGNKKAAAWVRTKYGYAGGWKRNAIQDLVPLIVQERLPIPRRPRPPAKVDDRVIEIEKPAHPLYVVHVRREPNYVEMAYSIGGTIAVGATWDDFKKFFKVVK